MTETEEFFYGKEYSNDMDRFKGLLKSIEEKYIDYFKERKNPMDEKDHDRLHNHYIIFTHVPRITFSFKEKTELPQKIIDECNAAFEQVFRKKSS